MNTPEDDLYATRLGPGVSLEIPGFRIIEELGRGAFGVVYRAHDIVLDRPVAVKVALVDDPSRRDEYIQEAQKAARLNIDGVVPVYQVGRLDSGMPFVVNMLMEGGTLRQEMKQIQGIAPNRICDIMIRLAKVVAQAHAARLIHRDLKPENILLDKRGEPWIGDFGLALSESEQRRHKGERAGTPVYMSPEQIQGRAEWLDGRTDIYALGIIFYELLVGQPPFTARTRKELEEEILHRDPKPLTQYLTGIPPEVDLIFRKCCAKQTNDRYANALELVRDLEIAQNAISSSDLQHIGSARSLFTADSQRSSGRKTTRRDTVLPTERQEQPRATIAWIPWTVACLALLVGSAAWYHDWQTHARDQHNSAKTIVPDDENIEPRPRPPVLRVSAKLDSSIRTVAEAIRLARPDETIFIEPGRYDESDLALSRNVTLQAADEKNHPVISSSSSDTLTIVEGAQVTLKNLKLENSSVKANTVQVKQGSVTIDTCAVWANSWQCVKAIPGTSVQLLNSIFHSGSQQIVFVEGVNNLRVQSCHFHVTPRTVEGVESYPYALDARDCSGKVALSTFDRGDRGINWENATTGHVILEGNSFQSCDIPIQFQNVLQSTIQGIPGKVTISDCLNGIELIDSSASIRDLNMSGTKRSESQEKSHGIRVSHRSKSPVSNTVSITACEVQRFEQGLHVVDSHADVTLDHVGFSNNSVGVDLEAAHEVVMRDSVVNDAKTGVRIGDCMATLKNCTFENDVQAIFQDSPFETRTALNCDQATFLNGGVALTLQSGSAVLNNWKVSSFLTAVSIKPSTNSTGRQLYLAAMTLKDCPVIINVDAPCQIEMDQDHPWKMRNSLQRNFDKTEKKWLITAKATGP